VPCSPASKRSRRRVRAHGTLATSSATRGPAHNSDNNNTRDNHHQTLKNWTSGCPNYPWSRLLLGVLKLKCVYTQKREQFVNFKMESNWGPYYESHKY
jgi:hypothetical protein